MFTPYTQEGDTVHEIDYRTHRDRHAERVARSLTAYDTRLPTGRSGRSARGVRGVRAQPCPLVALAQWLTAHRRPSMPVVS